MYKIIFILSVFVLLESGCSVTRKSGSKGKDLSLKNTSDILKLTQNQNITNSSFYIEKGRISTSGESGRITLLFTMKYRQPGIYLISLKSTTGIEAFRVYLTNDTVLINDRINKITYMGEPYDFEKITGLPAALLKISIGDFFSGNKQINGEEKCIENNVMINNNYQGLSIKSIIDCSIGKAKSVSITAGISGEKIDIFYSKFRNDFYKAPSKIEVNDNRRNVKILIKVEKQSIPWNGNIEFIPGKGFTLKRL